MAGIIDTLLRWIGRRQRNTDALRDLVQTQREHVTADDQLAWSRSFLAEPRPLNPSRVWLNNRLLAQQIVDTAEHHARLEQTGLDGLDNREYAEALYRRGATAAQVTDLIRLRAEEAELSQAPAGQPINGVSPPLSGEVELRSSDTVQVLPRGDNLVELLIRARPTPGETEGERMAQSYFDRQLGQPYPTPVSRTVPYISPHSRSRPVISTTELMAAVTPAECARLKPAEIRLVNQLMTRINAKLVSQFPGRTHILITVAQSIKPHIWTLVRHRYAAAGWTVTNPTKRGEPYTFTAPAPAAEVLEAAVEGATAAAMTPENAARTRVVDLRAPVTETTNAPA